MLAKACSCAVIGLDGALVEVEVDIGHGLPAFSIVGLPDAAVTEAKERVRAAIKNSGAIFPMRRIIVNLAPADLRKAGPAYDLPIAIAILMASEQAPFASAVGTTGEAGEALFLGELSLDGSLRHTRGILPMVALARDRGIPAVYVPAMDAAEAALVEDIAVYPVEHLAQLVAHLRGEQPIAPYVPNGSPLDSGDDTIYPYDLADVRGQEHVKRALEVAASGGHNMLMVGPPGSGKTLLARTVPSILPPLSPRRGARSHPALQRQRACSAPIGRSSPAAPSARRTTPSATRASSAADAGRVPARSAWRIAACSSWTSCRSSARTCWRCCASRSKTTSSRSAARRAPSPSPPTSC